MASKGEDCWSGKTLYLTPQPRCLGEICLGFRFVKRQQISNFSQPWNRASVWGEMIVWVPFHVKLFSAAWLKSGTPPFPYWNSVRKATGCQHFFPWRCPQAALFAARLLLCYWSCLGSYDRKLLLGLFLLCKWLTILGAVPERADVCHYSWLGFGRSTGCPSSTGVTEGSVEEPILDHSCELGCMQYSLLKLGTETGAKYKKCCLHTYAFVQLLSMLITPKVLCV